MQQARARARRTESRGTAHLTFKGTRIHSPSYHCYSHPYEQWHILYAIGMQKGCVFRQFQSRAHMS